MLVARICLTVSNPIGPVCRQSRGVPVAVVDLCVLAQQLLLALLVGPESSHLVAVLFGLEEGNQVDASPHLLAGKLAKRIKVVSLRRLYFSRVLKFVLGLPNTANQLVPAVAHDGAHAEEEDSRSEALGRQVSLNRGVSLVHRLPCCSPQSSGTHDIWQVYISIVAASNPDAGACFPRHNPMATSKTVPTLRRTAIGPIAAAFIALHSNAPCTGRARTRPGGAYLEA